MKNIESIDEEIQEEELPELDDDDNPIIMEGKPLKQASYPMVPVNVLEPLIDILLSENSRLYCEEN